jgi:hypothetical protein
MARIIDARGVAARLGVTPATVLAWARRGWVPCLRAGRRPVLFDIGEVERALGERGGGRVPSRAVSEGNGLADQLRPLLDLAERLRLPLATGQDILDACRKGGRRG